MSQRLPIHPRVIDPSTGEPLLALKIIGNLPVWPLMGGDDGSQGEGSGDNSGGDGEGIGEGEGEGGQGEGESGDSDGKSSEGDTVSKADFDRLMARMQAADRRASAAENKVREFEKAGQTELEKAQSEAAEEKKRADAAAEALKAERIANAFLASNDVTWHNPDDARSMLLAHYMEGVEIDENGKVTGMKDAIKKMAKEKAYLIKGETSTSSTGDQMNGKRKGDNGGDKKAADEALARRFPALSRNRPQ